MAASLTMEQAKYTSEPALQYPGGWFQMGWSRDLKVGQIDTQRVFGEEIILFRGANRTVSMLDAYCPHLGAHLGVGAKVMGNCVRCPFHGWKFGQDGTCTEVPYAKKIPPKARLRTWPVKEQQGMIFGWYDPAGGDPTQVLPPLFGDAPRQLTPWLRHARVVRRQDGRTDENIILSLCADTPDAPLMHRTLETARGRRVLVVITQTPIDADTVTTRVSMAMPRRWGPWIDGMILRAVFKDINRGRWPHAGRVRGR